MKNINKPKNLKEVMLLQSILNKKIEEKRDNGFTPARRTRTKILLSIIAECIELNEELAEWTHKTWKQKDYSEDKVKEELTDILFFIAEYLNYMNRSSKREAQEFKWGEMESGYYNVNELTIGIFIDLDKFRGSLGIKRYCSLVKALGYTEEEIYEEYYRKWQINTTRIAGEWTNLE